MHPDIVAAFQRLKARPKFVEEDAPSLYTGLQPEADRLTAERELNDLIDRLMVADAEVPADDLVLAQFAETLSRFPGTDTEDRERMCMYLEEIMDIVGLESSNGLLNGWLYGEILGGMLGGKGIPTV